MARQRLSSIYNAISNPGGGFSTTPSAGLSIPSNSPLLSVSKNLTLSPLDALRKKAGAITPPGVAAAQAAQNGTASAPSPSFDELYAQGSAAAAARDSQGNGNGNAQLFGAPISTDSNPSGNSVSIPPAYLNADGSFKTPDEIASGVGSSLRAAHENPDIGTLSLEQFGGNGQTTAQAETEARRINNARNDIAVGETDPYKVAAQSGIAYTPEELSAIEKAYSGIYDPALDTALTKVQDKQASDAAAAQAAQPFTLGKDEVRYDADGNPIAVGIPSDTGTGTGAYTPGTDPTADAYVQGIQAGTLKMTDVPADYKNLVAQGLSQTSSNAPLSKTSIDALGIIRQLQGLGDDKLGGLSGTGLIGSVEHPSSLFPGTDVQNTQNLAKQLQSVLSLANRQQLKGQGQISDFEFRVLGDASSALGINANGRTNLSPEQFKDQLHKLEVRLEVGQTKSLTDDEVQYLSQQGYSPDQIRAYDQQESGGGSGKASVGNTTASGNIPQRNNNPGDVKAGGIADSLAVGKDQYGHLIFASPADGFKALTADLTAKINGGSSHLPANPTIAQLGSVYAEDPNWGARVASILGVPASTKTKSVPIDRLAQAIATQEGFYA